MRLIAANVDGKERFVFDCSFEHKEIAKNAGFRWDSLYRHWHTTDAQIAARLKIYAQAELAQKLSGVNAQPKIKPTLSYVDGKFIFKSEKADKDIAKTAGFFWSPDDLHWWTSDPQKADAIKTFATPDCAARLSDMLAERDTLIEASRAAAAEINAPCPDGIDYLPYQKACLAFAQVVFAKEPQVGMLIGDAPGLGKTIEAIGIINMYESINKVLVICPSTLKLNWSRELHKWLVRPAKIVIADSKTAAWKLKEADIVIINYEALAAHIVWGRTGKSKAPIEIESLGNLALDWDLCVVDECHLIKSPKTQRSIFTMALMQAAKRKVGMTGTPIVNRPVELYPIINALDKYTWGNWYQYVKRYCDAQRTAFGMDVSGGRNLAELQDKLRGSIMIRRLKEDVLKELPPKTRQVIEFQIEDKKVSSAIRAEQTAWQQKQNSIAELKAEVQLSKASPDDKAYDKAVEKLVGAVRFAFEEIARVRHETAVAKVPYVISHLKELLDDDPTYKVVVMAWHNDVINALCEAFGDRAVKVTGEVSMKTRNVNGIETSDRQQAVDRFQTDESCQLFVGNIRAAGVGLTLTRSAHLIFAELDYVPGNMTQAEDRIHRVGQKANALIQHLVLEGSIDANIARTLVEKQTTIDRALDVQGRDVEDPHAPVDTTTAEEKEQPLVPMLESAIHNVKRARIQKEAAEITERQIAAVHLGLRILAGMCDGAAAQDGMGFNKIDTCIGKRLAERILLLPSEASLGKFLLLKYHRQLPEQLLATIKGK